LRAAFKTDRVTEVLAARKSKIMPAAVLDPNDFQLGKAKEGHTLQALADEWSAFKEGNE
jgi:hypothetical protein